MPADDAKRSAKPLVRSANSHRRSKSAEVMGVVDLEARQGAVARWRRRQGRHQARSCAVLRSGRRLDDRPHQGPAVLDRPRARRHQAARQFFQRHAMPGSPNLLKLAKVVGRPQTLSADRSRRRDWRRWRRSAALELHPWNCAPDALRHAGAAGVRSRSRAGGRFRDVIEAAKEMRERLTASASRASARPPAARACTS